MFSGIVETLAPVESIGRASVQSACGGSITRLAVRLGAMGEEIAPGASVSVNGVCLTLVSQADGVATFDLLEETLRRTNLGTLRPGDGVNIERSLRAGDRIDGHFVQGHVECTGRVRSVRPEQGDFRLTVELPDAYLRYVIPKGSIAIDGVSMTVVEVAGGAFSVAVIPTTWRRTTLGVRGPGEWVNIETDIISRTVVSRLDEVLDAGNASEESLRVSLRSWGITP